MWFCSKKNHMYGNKFAYCPFTIHWHTIIVSIQWSYSRCVFSIHVHQGLINKWTLVDKLLYNPVERNTMSTTHNMGGRSVQWRKKEWRRISSSSSCSLSVSLSLSSLLCFFFQLDFLPHFVPAKLNHRTVLYSSLLRPPFVIIIIVVIIINII